jgi:hypothetical protein
MTPGAQVRRWWRPVARRLGHPLQSVDETFPTFAAGDEGTVPAHQERTDEADWAAAALAGDSGEIRAVCEAPACDQSSLIRCAWTAAGSMHPLGAGWGGPVSVRPAA